MKVPSTLSYQGAVDLGCSLWQMVGNLRGAAAVGVYEAETTG